MTQWKDLLNPDLLGVSEEMTRLRKHVENLAALKEHVLIYGEPGCEMQSTASALAKQTGLPEQNMIFFTGKELNRKATAIDTWMKEFDSETDLVLVIDQIQDLNSKTQKKLFKILQSIDSLTLSKSLPFAHRLRVVATALPELVALMSEKKFNDKLFASLSSFTIKIPSLSRRLEDIPLIFGHMVETLTKERGIPVPPISFELVRDLLSHNWPQNLIELEKTAGSWVEGIHTGIIPPIAVPHTVQRAMEGEIGNLPAVLGDMERELLQRALKKYNGKQRSAARALGIAEPLLRYKMKKYDLYKSFAATRGRPRKS